MTEASLCLLLLIWSDPHVFVCVFQRLSTANDEIVEVLLSKQQVLGALRFIRSVGAHDNVSARKFLDAAQQTNDTMLFYTIFRFFEQRNMRLRGNPGFNQGKWFWCLCSLNIKIKIKIYFIFIDWSWKHQHMSGLPLTSSSCFRRALWGACGLL